MSTNTLLFEILHQERRGHVNTIVMEHFNGILFHKSGPANKQHSIQPTNQPIYEELFSTEVCIKY